MRESAPPRTLRTLLDVLWEGKPSTSGSVTQRHMKCIGLFLFLFCKQTGHFGEGN